MKLDSVLESVAEHKVNEYLQQLLDILISEEYPLRFRWSFDKRHLHIVTIAGDGSEIPCIVPIHAVYHYMYNHPEQTTLAATLFCDMVLHYQFK